MDEHPSIRLVAEHVSVHVSLDRATNSVDCIFVLSNEGSADSVTIGFPELSGGDTSARPFTSFRSYIDGHQVDCIRQRGESCGKSCEVYWWTKRVFFDAGQTSVIRDQYEAPLGMSIGDSTGNFVHFEYSLWTGSSWAKAIGSGAIALTVSPCDSLAASGRYRGLPISERTGCEYRWHITDSEPGRGSPGEIHVGWLIPFSHRSQQVR
jgi:hypothetical protein